MRPRAVVVGSGFGGLALAVRLQSGGYDVTLLEKRDKPGGRAYVFEDAGFTFDAGPTIITDPGCVEELFALSGRRLADYAELLPVSPMYRLHWEDGTTFDYVNDGPALEQQIARLSPDDVRGYRQFLAYSRDLFWEGYVKLGSVPFIDIASMVKAGPQLFRLEAYRSVYAMVSKFVQHPKLRQAFSFHPLLVGGNPFETSAVYALIHAIEREWGIYFAKGGTGALVRALVKLFEDLGGKLELNCAVEELLVENQKVVAVQSADGRRWSCNLVGTNADVVHTYEKLLGKTRRGKRESHSLKQKRYSMSLFVIYFGLRGEYPDLVHHNIYFGPRYREHIDDIFKRDMLAEDFSLYLHVPTATDKNLAPPGCSSFYVLSPVPHLGVADIDWQVEGPKYADRILDYLEERYIPGLKSNLVTRRIFTPEDFKETLNAHVGSAFSLEPVLTQSAYFRVHNRDSQISNLYFVGAGTHPGAGLPGVIGSAKATANLIFKDAKQLVC